MEQLNTCHISSFESDEEEDDKDVLLFLPIAPEIEDAEDSFTGEGQVGTPPLLEITGFETSCKILSTCF